VPQAIASIADLVVHQAGAKPGGTYLAIAWRRTLPFRMKDPQAPVRNEVIGGDGNLCKIARRIDS